MIRNTYWTMDIEMHFHFLGFQQYELKHWFPSIRMKTLSENKTKQRISYKFLSLIKKRHIVFVLKRNLILMYNQKMFVLPKLCTLDQLQCPAP